MWRQLIIELGELDVETLEEALLEAGACAVTLQEAGDRPVLEPAPGEHPLWDRTRLIALFDEPADIEHALRQACNSLDLATTPPHRVEILQEREWERAWLDDFRPMRFGERLWVCPTGMEPPRPGTVNIVLDPGLAFGTGTHATTALCLEWLDAADPVGWEVIDYGCGSGVLAIAAARLGAQRVWAVDHDPQALLATRDNAQRNDVHDRVFARLPEELPALTVDALLANILAEPLIRLAPRFAELVRPGGHIVLAGLLDAQAAEIRDAYDQTFALDHDAERDGWLRLSGRRLRS